MSKKLFVLHSIATRPSAKALRDKLRTCQELAGGSVVSGDRDSLVREMRIGRTPDVVINMGTIGALPYGYEGTVLNTPSAISCSSNKLRARQVFEKEGIPAPKLWTSGNIPRDVYPLVGRTTKHSKGRGFWFCRNHHEASRAHYKGATHFMKFIENTREFRVHVVSVSSEEPGESGYVSIKMSEKVFEGDYRGQETDVMKNRTNGWVFKHPNEISASLLANLRTVAKDATSKFGLHWGAVDIMVDKDTDELYVLEINSSPRLTDQHANTIDKYSDWILHLAGLKVKDIKVSSAPVQKYVAAQKKVTKKFSTKDPDIQLVQSLFRRIGL